MSALPPSGLPLLFVAAPVVPSWMAAEGEHVRSVASGMAGSAEELRRAAETVRGLLVDAAGALGWISNAASATSARAEQTGDRFGAVAAQFDQAAAALVMLASELTGRSRELPVLQRRRVGVIEDAQAAPMGAMVGDPHAVVRAIDQRIRSHVDALTAADRTVADRLEVVAGVVRALAQVTADDGWVTSLAAPEVFGAVRAVSSGQALLASLPAGASGEKRALAVSAWFLGLSPLEQMWLTQSRPELIGNLDGIPFGVRDQANQNRLAAAHAQLAAQLASFVPAGVDPLALGLLTEHTPGLDGALWDRIDVLQQIEVVLARPDRHLLTLDLTGTTHARAAVAVGDVDTAANVAVFIPGFSTTVAGGLRNHDLHMFALSRLASKEAFNSGRPDSVAAVTWIGYDAPQLSEIANPAHSVVGSQQAQTGGLLLNGFFAGISAVRIDDPHVTALGHSYGSLTTASALKLGHDGVDDVVFFGSPGLGTDNIKDLHVPDGHTFVVEARDDPVADAAAFGPDPNQMDGVTNLSGKEGRTPDGVSRSASVGHSAYLAENSTSEYNMALVVAGLGDQVIEDRNFGLGDAGNYPFAKVSQWLN